MGWDSPWRTCQSLLHRRWLTPSIEDGPTQTRRPPALLFRDGQARRSRADDCRCSARSPRRSGVGRSAVRLTPHRRLRCAHQRGTRPAAAPGVFPAPHPPCGQDRRGRGRPSRVAHAPVTRDLTTLIARSIQRTGGGPLSQGAPPALAAESTSVDSTPACGHGFDQQSTDLTGFSPNNWRSAVGRVPPGAGMYRSESRWRCPARLPSGVRTHPRRRYGEHGEAMRPRRARLQGGDSLNAMCPSPTPAPLRSPVVRPEGRRSPDVLTRPRACPDSRPYADVRVVAGSMLSQWPPRMSAPRTSVRLGNRRAAREPMTPWRRPLGERHLDT